jgi:hypothetical protein
VFIPSRRKRREFEAAWIERAERSTPKGIKAVYKWWREDKRRPKPSAARWIDWRLGQIPFDPQTDQFPHYDVTVGGEPQVPVRVWMDPSGQITSQFGAASMTTSHLVLPGQNELQRAAPRGVSAEPRRQSSVVDGRQHPATTQRTAQAGEGAATSGPAGRANRHGNGPRYRRGMQRAGPTLRNVLGHWPHGIGSLHPASFAERRASASARIAP